MCGIFGFTAPGLDANTRMRLGSALGALNDSRGGDAWGVLSVNGKRQIDKDLGAFKRRPVWLDRFRLTAPLVLGHTRKATTGAHTIANAHPFRVGGVVGAHNGIVFNHRELNARLGRAFPVDSMHIFGHLAEAKPLTDLEGYGAIWWQEDTDPGAAYLCRFAGGALEAACLGTYTPDGSGWLGAAFSSTQAHLLDAIKATGIDEHRLITLETSKVYRLHAGVIWKTDRTLTLAPETYAWSTGAGFRYHPWALDETDEWHRGWAERGGQDGSADSADDLCQCGHSVWVHWGGTLESDCTHRKCECQEFTSIDEQPWQDSDLPCACGHPESDHNEEGYCFGRSCRCQGFIEGTPEPASIDDLCVCGHDLEDHWRGGVCTYRDGSSNRPCPCMQLNNTGEFEGLPGPFEVK